MIINIFKTLVPNVMTAIYENGYDNNILLTDINICNVSNQTAKISLYIGSKEKETPKLCCAIFYQMPLPVGASAEKMNKALDKGEKIFAVSDVNDAIAIHCDGIVNQQSISSINQSIIQTK